MYRYTPMIRFIQSILCILFLVIITGFIIALVGISALPDINNQPLINPETRQIYTLEERKITFNSLLLASSSFKLLIIGCALVIVSLICIGIIYLLRNHYSSNTSVSIEDSSYTGNPMVAQVVNQPIESVAVSVAKDPLPMHLPSTIDVPTPILSPKTPLTWSRLKLEHLGGHRS